MRHPDQSWERSSQVRRPALLKISDDLNWLRHAAVGDRPIVVPVRAVGRELVDAREGVAVVAEAAAESPGQAGGPVTPHLPGAVLEAGPVEAEDPARVEV